MDTWKRRSDQDEICYDIAKKFAESQDDFNELMAKMSAESIDREYFAPVVLDIYDRNRNLESIRNDSDLRNRVKILFRDAEEFVEGKSNDFYREITPLEWTEFIYFILRYNHFDFEHEPRLEKVEELFSKKDAYRKFVKLFKNFLNNKNAYHRYVANQVDDWERIREYIL